MKTAPKEFWIVNISNKDISIDDLYLTIRAKTSINLLDSKHYYFTWDQVFKSITSGSIFKKRNKIFIRKIPPKFEQIKLQVDEISVIPCRSKSIYEVKEEKYEELNVTDEQFVEENLDLAT